MITTDALLVLALGVSFGLGLMSIIHAVLAWDGQRRIANEMREAAEERRRAIARAAASQPPARGVQPRPARPEPRPAGPPSQPEDPWQDHDRYHPRRARPASSTEGLPFLGHAGEWMPAPVNGQPARPYVKSQF